MSQMDAFVAWGSVDTSRAAAASLDMGKVEQDCNDIKAALGAYGRLTRPELERITKIQTQSITARLRGLCLAGEIVRMDETKRGPSGRACHLYRLAA
jgi:hypothetical protein